ncbi:DPP IV N-terminal domain-containing protein [Mariniblastus sp.]|nr:DPP IV N-terminal domain-containing protein [Mariniblastus sp.]
MSKLTCLKIVIRLSSVVFIVCLLITAAQGQRTSSAMPGVVNNVKWNEDSVDYSSAGKRYRFDFSTSQKSEIDAQTSSKGASKAGSPRSWRRSTDQGASTGKYLGRPLRGRQYTEVESPDGKWRAKYRDWNLVLENLKTKELVNVTTDGDEDVHFGTASWVYGEELGQKKAMWWTPDSGKIIYYKFDDTLVEKFFLLRGWSKINTSLYPEYYAKAGAKNPISELFVYDLKSKKTIRIDIGGSGDEYIYGLRMSPLGDRVLLNWTDRLQQHLKVVTVDLESGECKAIIEERQKTWQENSPAMRFLKDKKRFLWPTDKTGFTHYEVRDLEGNVFQTVTKGDFQINSLEVFEDENLVSFVANSSIVNPYYMQYHLVGLDGKQQRRVTTLDYHHSNFQLSPDRKWLIAQYEAVNRPPSTAIYRTDGKFVANLAEQSPAEAANLAEMFKFRSDDDQFDIYGILYKPNDFDPTKIYPVINALYGGPGSREISARYVSRPRSECEQGYLVVKVNNRGTGGRGKSFLGAAYLKLGDVDIQDHADAIRILRKRPYVDGDRVGIVGHSYGGFMAAMGIFKHPDVYTAAVDRAGPTDWRNYDTIYTERYMSTPQLNPDGYKMGAAMTHVKNLKGKILIMHGMVDDNVHPNNAFQLIDALDRAGLTYESRFWPNGGHGLGRGVDVTQGEFFKRTLRPEAN